MARPLVSIVINNFNYARFLPESIGSALAQTYPSTEVVVVDDASSDDSAQIIRSYAERVIPVLRERNGGQGAAMNSGVGASRGDLVMLLDADDYLYPQAAERVVAAWSESIAQVQYRLDLVNATGTKIDIYPPPEVSFDSGDVLPLLLSRGRFETTITSGTAFSRAALMMILPIPEADFRISADGYLVTLAAFHGRVASIDEPLGAYRLHGANAWSLVSKMGPAELAERLRRFLQHDEHRIGALQVHAHANGRNLDLRPELRDHRHLATRIASLRLAPAEHPYRNDSSAVLGIRGASAACAANSSRRSRLVLAAWFLTVGLLPRSFATPAVLWRLTGASRPRIVDRVLKFVRRVVR